jgi:diadenosine tetraphosphate (Ap4A) HIT family hydrolase
MFTLHPKLAEDCIELGRFGVCRLLLMNDANYPWFILVPERANISEMFQLSNEDQLIVMCEITVFTRAVADAFRADKINVAALGNVVPQLHIHVVARFRTDPAWPNPIWGAVPLAPYPPDAVKRVCGTLLPWLTDFQSY